MTIVACLLMTMVSFGQVATLVGQEKNFIRELSVEEFEAVLNGKNWIVVDARSPDQFNGWALGTEKVGGHIDGAVDFSASWLSLDIPNRQKQLERILKSKKILPARNVVIYSSAKQDRTLLAGFLEQLGFKNICGFDLEAWTAAEKPLKRSPGFTRLLPPSIVKQLVDGGSPATFENSKRIKFVEVSWGDESKSYAKGHIPGSIHVNTDHFEPPPSWYLGEPKVLQKFASDYGLQCDDTVIISSEDVTAGFRLAIVLEYMGVADVRVINGGVKRWRMLGYPIEIKRHPIKPSSDFGAKIPVNHWKIRSTELVKESLASRKDFALVDTRTWQEFIGQTSGYSYHKIKGRIPGAVYGQADFRGNDSMRIYRNVDETMRNPDEILQLWQAAGIEADQHLCFYCGGGWRAAEVLMYARIMGRDNSSLYSDGWIGWSRDSNNPRKIGDKP